MSAETNPEVELEQIRILINRINSRVNGLMEIIIDDSPDFKLLDDINKETDGYEKFLLNHTGTVPTHQRLLEIDVILDRIEQKISGGSSKKFVN